MDVTDPAPDNPRVVDIFGKEVIVQTTTSGAVMDHIEGLRSVAAGEKHLAVGMFLVDDKGRVWTNFYIEKGANADSIAAVTLLQHRVIKAYEGAHNP